MYVIITQCGEGNRKGKAKEKVTGVSKRKSQLEAEEVLDMHSSPNKPSSQDWAISDSEDSEPIQKVKHHS